ncbi:MAG TPA: hypothetical protein DEZ08_02895 [Dehalococcoidia bacterium]|jgi:hypothetical protein|nr:hypothetical protein [Dehalococcoidia bacterium]|tara:strand:- start:966 stop:1412 length:447 start_codon:yes stop_codon:yes gene_type:complete
MPENSKGDLGFWRNSKEYGDVILNEDAVNELSDLILQYMTEIDFKDLPSIIGQVLDDFADQSGCMPTNLEEGKSFESIVNTQLAVTLAYQLGRLDGKSSQIIDKLVDEVVSNEALSNINEESEISNEDLNSPVEKVYPKLRLINFSDQ